MAYIAPSSPGTEGESNWYVPIMGFAGGAANAPRWRSWLPWLTSGAGGSNLPGPGRQMAKDLYTTMDELRTMDPGIREALAQRSIQGLNQGYKSVLPREFQPPMWSGNMADKIPPPAVWARAISAAGGMNDPRVQRMLGFGR